MLQPLVPLTVPFVKVAEATTSPSSAPSSVFLASTQVVPSKVVDEPAVVGDALTSFELAARADGQHRDSGQRHHGAAPSVGHVSTPLVVAAFWSTGRTTIMLCGQTKGDRLAR